MPYYKEQFVNAELTGVTTAGSAVTNSGPIVMDSTELMTFRSRPHRDAVWSKEQTASSVDPYASFLEQSSKLKYQARLKERGLAPEGEPDRGHSFELKRHTVVSKPTTVSWFDGIRNNSYVNCYVYPTDGTGKLTSVHGGNVFNPAPYMETGLDAFAQQAYNRTAPTAVVFNAGQFLGELHEGLPRLVPELLQGSASLLKRAGSDYLNVEFGWKPFLADLQNAGKALLGATNSFSQMGKRVHRRYQLPLLERSDSMTGTGIASLSVQWTRGVTTSHVPSSVPTSIGTSANLNTEYTVGKYTRSQRWFEGEFTSFLPLRFDPNDYLQKLSVLMDPSITPSVLWELTPWSWLIDWNLRIGDTIRANELNANDRLIMHYGYAMEHTVYQTEVHWKNRAFVNTPNVYTNRPLSGKLWGQTEYKRRLRANPYGFRVGGIGSLTGGQTAILGALGLTKFK